MTEDKAALFELHADICKALASPARLRIIDFLGSGERTAGEVVEALGARKADVSQHLAVMRQKGIVVARRDGASVIYRLASPKVLRACDLMREVLLDQIRGRGQLMTSSVGIALGGHSGESA